MTVMPRIPSRKSKVRRSSFVAPTDRASGVPDALSWRTKVDGELAPKGPAAWSAASSVQSDRAVVNAGPYGVIDLAVLESVPDAPGPKPQLGVVWWDKGSLREEDYEDGTIQTSFIPASLTDHVSFAGSPGPVRALHPSPSAPAVSPAVEADLRPRQAGDHASLAEQQGGAAPIRAVPPTVREPRRRDRARPSGGGRRVLGAPVTVAPAAPAAPAVPAAPASPAPTVQSSVIADPVVPLAPPVSATRHPELDESNHRRHARRARHVELVPKTLGRRAVGTSHPRRTRLRRRRSRRRVVLSVILVLAAFVVTLVVQNVIVTPFTVPSSSMQNTLHTDDRILVNKFAYSLDTVHRGDVVVFEDPGGWIAGSRDKPSADGKEYIVKRVVGTPGDHVSCCSAAGRLTVNGTEVYEPYAVVPEGQPASHPFDVTVPAGALWVLGDNRYNSRDSTQTQDQPTKGFVPIAQVVGRAVLKLWPLNQFAPVDSSSELASIPAQTCPT